MKIHLQPLTIRLLVVFNPLKSLKMRKVDFLDTSEATRTQTPKEDTKTPIAPPMPQSVLDFFADETPKGKYRNPDFQTPNFSLFKDLLSK